MAKAGALALIAIALNRGDLAMVAIATVQMQFPDPPPLAKAAESDDEIIRRAAELCRSGLLKASWDPAKHPRTGTKPNPGRFAPVPKPTSVPSVKPRAGWPLPYVNEAARAAVRSALGLVERNAGEVLVQGLRLVPWIEGFLAGFTPVELNQGEDRLIAQLKSAFEPPKTLEELQQEPTEDNLGYEQHHIVNQNPDNLAKDSFEKFGSELINDPSNIVWLPRLQHECVNAEYSENSDGSGTPLVREIVNNMDFDNQYEEGLKILRKCGVLK
ncbi:MAG: AHH domain-containing protein [Xanthobacteraceae bacterium]|jgi:hypothetical protein